MNTTIPEEMVQDFVYDQFADLYKNRSLYISCEEYTNEKNRADVFIAFPQKRQTAYVIVIEAKSRKTLKNLKYKSDKGKVTYISLLIVAFFFILICSFFYFYNYKNPPILSTAVSILIVQLVLLGIFGVGKIIFKANKNWSKTIPVIDQIAQYPANEKWIAFSTDTFTSDVDYSTLLQAAKKRGVGILEFDENGYCDEILKPKYIKQIHEHDFLVHYKKENEIREQIGYLRGFYKMTKAQKTHAYIKYKQSVAIVLLILILSYYFCT